MFELTCKIRITGAKSWVLDKITSCEIVLDCDSLSDTCKITIPKKAVWKNEKSTPVRKGDKLEVWLGYNNDLKLRFVGYVTKIGTQTPVLIGAEDSMYLLKSASTKKNVYKSVELEKLLSDILPSNIAKKVLGSQSLSGTFRITESTVAGVLDQLSEYGIKSFFKLENDGPVLHCGIIHGATSNAKYRFNDHEGSASIIQNKTEYVRKEDVKLKVTAVSIDSNNKKTEVVVGDPDGEERTIHTYNKNESDLKKWAQTELDGLKYDGLSGTIEVFGAAPIDKYDVIQLEISNIEKGSYLTKKVTVNFGSTYTQTIELERKVS